MENMAQAATASRSALDSPLLTPQELESYHRDGFIVPRFRLSKDETTRLHDMILRLVDMNPHFRDFLMQGPHVPGTGSLGLKSFPGWMDFAAHPVLLDIIEQIMGPDIILRGTVAFYKHPGEGPATAWHRDATSQNMTPVGGTHVWIAASDSYVDNACLRFIPGSHTARTVGEHTFVDFDQKREDGSVAYAALKESEYDVSKAVNCELEAGQMVIFDLFTAHASWPNTGTRERSSFALRYMPGTSFYDHDSGQRGKTVANAKKGYAHDRRPLMLVRGENKAGNDLKRGHPENEVL